MTDDDAAGHNAVFVENIFAGLTEHFGDGEGCDLEIVGCGGIFFREGGGVVFEVGEVDVDKSFKVAECLDTLVAAAVIDDGNIQLRADGFKDRNEFVREMGGGNEVYIVDAELLQLKHNLTEAFGADGFTVSAVADDIILTENTAEGTARKEYCS